MAQSRLMNALGGCGGVLVIGLALLGCSADTKDSSARADASVRLKRPPTVLAEPTIRRTVYVPVYSSIDVGLQVRQNIIQLAATVSIRNVSAQYPIVLNFVRYYDSAGALVRQYLSEPAELGPLATVEFVVPRLDTTGGPGANFLVQWVGPSDADEPLIEAVMIGQSGNAGISFTSPGRVIKNEPRQ
jgi:hypothetical protein